MYSEDFFILEVINVNLNSVNKLDFYIEWHHKENERNVALSDSLNIPIGIITAIAAAQFYLFSEYTFVYLFGFFEIIFLLLTGINLILWIVTVFFLFKSYYGPIGGHTYRYLPYPQTLTNQYLELQDYCQEYKDILEDGTTPESLAEVQLRDLVIECLSINIENNDLKSASIHNAKRILFLSLITLVVAFIPFAVNYHSNKFKIKQKSYMSTQSEKPQPPPPPKPPRTREVKEGGTPPPPPPPKREHK